MPVDSPMTIQNQAFAEKKKKKPPVLNIALSLMR